MIEKSKIKKIIGYLTDLGMSRTLLSMQNNGYLIETGWLNSYKKKQPIDKNNIPIPWVTYSFIEFIKPFLTSEKTLFEFGSGNSTLFYASKVKHVFTAEHNREWFEKINNIVPSNVTIKFFELDGLDYVRSILLFDNKFDIVIIDGRKRNECIKNTVNKITETGIIVLDDSERSDYNEGIDFLAANGFLKIDFWGPSPGYFHNKCTSIFYKNFNEFLFQK